MYLRRQKDLYSKNYKTLLKKKKKEMTQKAGEVYSWIGKINNVKMIILPKESTDSMQSLLNY